MISDTNVFLEPTSTRQWGKVFEQGNNSSHCWGLKSQQTGYEMLYPLSHADRQYWVNFASYKITHKQNQKNGLIYKYSLIHWACPFISVELLTNSSVKNLQFVKVFTFTVYFYLLRADLSFSWGCQSSDYTSQTQTGPCVSCPWSPLFYELEVHGTETNQQLIQYMYIYSSTITLYLLSIGGSKSVVDFPSKSTIYIFICTS